MAEAAPPRQTLLEIIAANQNLQAVLANARQRLGKAGGVPTYSGEIETPDYDTELLQGLVLTNLNGSVELQEQRVNVEYLRGSDRLQLPVALNLNPTTGSNDLEGPYAILLQRYWKVAAAPYRILKDIATTVPTYNEVRTRIDAMTGASAAAVHAPFTLNTGYRVSDTEVDTEEVACLIFATLSRALGFNCDLRDTSMLIVADMRMTDDFWASTGEPDLKRLRTRLHAYTQQCVVALNLKSVGECHLAAWVRAHALSAGILPNPGSVTVKEYDFVTTMPLKATMLAVSSWEMAQQFDIRSVCMNLVAMFGLLHLAKDHTYKSNDPEMMRICTSYIMTLRTMVPGETMDYMKTHMEALCRTAQHPFGLGQTYAVARIMAYHSRLAKPLQIRVTITPPPVQRLMIVRAATNEWKNVHVGMELNQLHAAELAIVNAEIDTIMASPPHYSGLSRLYGHPQTKTITDDAKNAADVMMPLIYGYAMSQHCDEQQKKDGIALALSLGNVSRDHGVLAQRFVAMWDNYMEKMEEEGLLRSAREARRNLMTPVTATV